MSTDPTDDPASTSPTGKDASRQASPTPMASAASPSSGRVYLIGAGPGDPGMLTVRGRECLETADVVLYDYLVNPVLLEYVPEGVECVSMGSHAAGKLWKQDQINAELVRRAEQGQTVVRLKGGDPAVFARGAEEAETLAAHGIPFEIIPGITAALAAGSCCGIPITHRELASAVALITGHERSGQDGSKLDYESLAKFPGTLVFYMGTTTVETWSQGLMAGGLSPDTPVAVIRRCSFPDQTRHHCRLEEVAAYVNGPPKLRPPVIFIVGAVTDLAPTLNWFEQRSLFGQRVWVTRPQQQGLATAKELRLRGAHVSLVPAIEILPEPSEKLSSTLARCGEFDWLVFSSANGVDCFWQALWELSKDARELQTTRVAAIGPGTAARLERWHLRADFIPERYDADTLAQDLAASARGKKFLLIRASRGREVLAEQLAAAGGQVEQLVVYRSEDVPQPNTERLAELQAGEVDWVTVTSSAIARSLVNLYGDALRQTRLASISPITSETLRQLGYPPAVEAEEYTLAGLIYAMEQAAAAD